MLFRSNKYSYGWFGTYASYKYDLRIEEYIRLLGDSGSYLFVGKGYPKSLPGNVYSSHIPDYDYYTLMSSVNVLLVVYKDISFSGVIHDGVGLNKDFLANKLCKDYILKTYSEYYLVKEHKGLFLVSKNGKPKTKTYGWSLYLKKVFYV